MTNKDLKIGFLMNHDVGEACTLKIGWPAPSLPSDVELFCIALLHAR